jgi:hypothetical protein
MRVARSLRREEITMLLKVLILAATTFLSFSAVPATEGGVHVPSSKTSIAEIILNPAKYDRMEVKVEGAAAQVHTIPSPFGPLTGFFLVDGQTGARIGVVYVKGSLGVRDRSKITVQGIYYKAQGQTGNANVIEAISVN